MMMGQMLNILTAMVKQLRAMVAQPHWSTPNFAPNWNVAAADFAYSGSLDLVECGFKILSGCTTAVSRTRSFAARAP
jgi:hypothetical protein